MGGNIRWKFQLSGQDLYGIFCRRAVWFCVRVRYHRCKNTETGQHTERDQDGYWTGKPASNRHDIVSRFLLTLVLIIHARWQSFSEGMSLDLSTRVESRRD